MGLDYYVHRGCSIQRELEQQGFLEAMRRRRLARVFGGKLVVDGREVEVVVPAEGLSVSTLRGGCVEQMTITDAADGLSGRAGECQGCPASTAAEPFGCYGFLSYPISRATEMWLLERASRGGVLTAVSAEAVERLGVDGNWVAGLRAQGGTFFESEVDCAIVWELSDGEERSLSSNVLVELACFAIGRNLRQLFPFAAIMLGLVSPEQVTIPVLQGWMRDPSSMAPVLLRPTLEGNEEQGPMVELLGRIAAAGAAGFGLVLDG